jgi:hypothetical protein
MVKRLIHWLRSKLSKQYRADCEVAEYEYLQARGE